MLIVNAVRPVNGDYSLFILLGQDGHVEVVKLLLGRSDIKVNQANNNGMTPLHYAALKGHVRVVELLLSRLDIEINAAASNGGTPLHFAAQNGHVEVVKLLLNRLDIEINAASDNGATPLHCAAEKGHVEVAKLLFARPDVEVNQANNKGATPLHLATEKGYRGICLCLVTHGLIRKENRATGAQAILEEYTPLLNSIYDTLPKHNDLSILFSVDNREEILKMIEERLTELNGLDDASKVRVCGYCKKIRKKIDACMNCRWAYYCDAECQSEDWKRHKKLCCKVLSAPKERVLELLELSDVEKHACLIKAVNEGDVVTVRTLAVLGVPVDRVGSDSMTLLHTAASNGYSDIVKLLLHYGADIEAKGVSNGFTPLHCAALNNRLEVLNLLLKCGAHKEAQASCGRTALHIAVENGFLDGVKVLLENKVDPEVRTTEGFTALHSAVHYDRVERYALRCEELKRKAYDTTLPGWQRDTAREAISELRAHQGNLPANSELVIVDLLLLSKAQVNAQTEQGLTPLHYAAMLQKKDMCLRLLDEGAELDLEDVKEISPLLYAALTKNLDLCRAMLAYGLVRENTASKDASAILKQFTPLLNTMYSRLSEENPVKALFSANNRGEILKIVNQRLAELRERVSANQGKGIARK